MLSKIIERAICRAVFFLKQNILFLSLALTFMETLYLLLIKKNRLVDTQKSITCITFPF